MFDRRLAEQLLRKKEFERYMDDLFHDWRENMEAIYMAQIEQRERELAIRERKVDYDIHHHEEIEKGMKVLYKATNALSRAMRIIEKYEAGSQGKQDTRNRSSRDKKHRDK